MSTNVDKTYKLKAAETTLNLGCFAVLDSVEKQVIRPTGANAGKVAGCLQDATLAAEAVGNFRKFGYSKVKAAGVIAIGDDLVIADVQGRVISKGTGAHTSGTDIVGRAEEAATAAGDLIEAFINLVQFTS